MRVSWEGALAVWHGPGRAPLGGPLRGTPTVSVPLETVLEEMVWVHGRASAVLEEGLANHQGGLGTDRQMD